MEEDTPKENPDRSREPLAFHSPDQPESGPKLRPPESWEVEGIRVHLPQYLAKDPSITDEQIEALKAEIDRALGSLDPAERDFLRSADVSIVLKDSSISHPEYSDRVQILRIGIGASGEEIISTIREKILPPQVLPPTEDQAAEAQTPEPQEQAPAPEPQPVQENNTTENLPEQKAEEPKQEENKPADHNIPQTAESVEVEARQLEEQLDRMRIARAGIENDYRKGVVTQEYFETAIESYERDREALADKVKGYYLSQGKSEQGINEVLFEELVRKEHDAYLAALRDTKEKNWLDKGWDKAKLETLKALKSKVMQGYLNLPKQQRIALNFALGTTAGLAFGAGVGALGVAGYIGKRIFSGAAGVGAGEWAAKKWSIEELNQKEKEEEEALKNHSGFSLEDKSRWLEEIRERYKKERIKMTAKRIGVTAAAGMGTGLLTNLAESAYAGLNTGGATRSAVEVQGGKGSALEESKVVGRGGGGASEATQPDKPESVAVPEKPEAETVPELQPELEPQTPGLTSAEPAPAPTEAVEPAPTADGEKIFDDPAILKHEVVAGDSVWKILGKTLEHNDQFKSLTEAQKTYVVSTLANKIMEDPTSYGVGRGGAPEIGGQTDLSKLFEDGEKVRSIFDKAKETIAEGSLREKTILENNAKISAWMENRRPGEILDENKVSEILNTKPKAEDTITDTSPKVEPVPSPIPDKLEPTYTEIVEPVKSPMPDRLEQPEIIEPIKSPIAETLEPQEPAAKASAVSRDQIMEDIEKAKARIAELERGQTAFMAGGIGAAAGMGGAAGAFPESPLRSLRSDMEHLKKKESDPVEQALNNDVNEFFTEREGLSLSKTPGIRSKKWNFIRRLPFSKLVKYYNEDARKSGLTPEEMKELSRSDRYKEFFDHVLWLKGQTGGAAFSFTEETSTEETLRKIGSYLLRKNQNTLNRAA